MRRKVEIEEVRENGQYTVTGFLNNGTGWTGRLLNRTNAFRRPRSETEMSKSAAFETAQEWFKSTDEEVQTLVFGS